MGKRKKYGHWFYRITTEDLMRAGAALLIGLIALWLLISLSSCGVSRKAYSSSRSSVDSSATTSKVSEGKSQESATVDRSKDSSWESEVSVEFDTDAEERAKELAGPKDTAGQLNGQNIGQIPPKKPAGNSAGGRKNAGTYKVKVNGKTIESTVPIKSATIRENGQTRQLDITEITRQDSGRQEEVSTVNLEKKEVSTERKVFRWQIHWWVYLLVIGGAVAAWRLGWFKRDPMDDFEVKYKRHGKNNITDQT